MTDESETERIRKIVNGSGFPLQLAVETLVGQTAPRHQCRVLYTEHAWRSLETGDSGFIDLVIEQQRSNLQFVVECKRVLESSWVFLQPSASELRRRQAKVWETQYQRGQLQKFGWSDRAMEPRSPQSMYCVVAGQDAKSEPMLERVSANLVASTEAFAREDAARVKESPSQWSSVYVNVIVTTAKLVLASFKASDIPLTDGRINDLQTEEVPFLRFRKQLAFGVTGYPSPLPPEVARNPRDVTNAKERTVFVVQAQALADVLGAFEIDESTG